MRSLAPTSQGDALSISPFGSASEDFAKFETILLVGGKHSHS